MVTIGELKKTVLFKYNTPTTLGAGKKDNFITLVTTKGSLKKLGGSRNSEAGQELYQNRWELVTRYQSVLNEAIENNSYKIIALIDTKTFHIDSWERIDERPMFYKFFLSQSTDV